MTIRVTPCRPTAACGCGAPAARWRRQQLVAVDARPPPAAHGIPFHVDQCRGGRHPRVGDLRARLARRRQRRRSGGHQRLDDRAEQFRQDRNDLDQGAIDGTTGKVDINDLTIVLANSARLPDRPRPGWPRCPNRAPSGSCLPVPSACWPSLGGGGRHRATKPTKPEIAIHFGWLVFLVG